MTAALEAIWNTLHDGAITSCTGVIPGSVKLVVEVEYIATRLLPGSKALLVELNDCEEFAYDFHESAKKTIRMTNLSEITESGPIIIAGDREGESLIIECACGIVYCRYSGYTISLENESEVSYEAVLKACEDYWREWKEHYI